MIVLLSTFKAFFFSGQRQLRWAAGTLLTLLVSSWVISFVIAMKYNYVARVEEPFALFEQLYDKPWLRIGPYLVGMATGYFLYKTDCTISVSRKMALLGWCVSILTLFGLVYGIGRGGLRIPASALYVSNHKKIVKGL